MANVIENANEISNAVGAATEGLECRARKQRVTLTTAQKDKIRGLVAAGKDRSRIASKYGVSLATVHKLAREAEQPVSEAAGATVGKKRGRKSKATTAYENRVCGGCGAANEGTARFCSTCGASLMTAGEQAFYNLMDVAAKSAAGMQQYKKLQNMVPELTRAVQEVAKYVK